jgi:hypothetical protein
MYGNCRNCPERLGASPREADSSAKRICEAANLDKVGHTEYRQPESCQPLDLNTVNMHW